MFLARATPLKDANQRVVKWFGTNSDMGEAAKAHEASAFLMP
jgi:hypothetical protein